MNDILVVNRGSIFIIAGITADGIEWLQAHLPEDAQRWGERGYVVEHRYISDIVDGARADGMVVG